MLATSFVVLSLLMALLLCTGIARAARRAIPDKGRRGKFVARFRLLIAGWLVYITLLSMAGIFIKTSFPPRIPLLLVLPPFALTGYFFGSGKFKGIIAATPAAWPIYMQSFRIVVELLIWGSFVQGILPKAATFAGYNFDIVIGITAAPVAWLVYSAKALNKTLLLLWHTAGFTTLAIVVSVLIGHAYFYERWGLTESILARGFGKFPFTLLAGFLMPLAVFLHVFSIVRTGSKSMSARE